MKMSWMIMGRSSGGVQMKMANRDQGMLGKATKASYPFGDHAVSIGMDPIAGTYYQAHLYLYPSYKTCIETRASSAGFGHSCT